MNGPIFFPEALAEYEDAVAYFESREVGLGDRLVEEFEAALALMLEFPHAAAPVREAPARYALRWTMLRTFPLKLVHTVRDETLIVVAVFHARRRPGYWAERLKRLE